MTTETVIRTLESQQGDGIYVDATRCCTCGICAAECPLHLEIGRVEPGGENCIRCLHCYAICPNQAIRIPDDIAPGETYFGTITPEELENLLAFRRSVRHFSEQEVPREVMSRILGAARHVPSGGNRHAYEFTVITRSEVRQRLRKAILRYYDGKRKLIKNPILLFLARRFASRTVKDFLNDPVYFERIKAQLDDFFSIEEDRLFFDAPALLIIHSAVAVPTGSEDAFLAGYNAVLIAQTLGLGSCFISQAQIALAESQACRTAIGLPPGQHVFATLGFGYPAVPFKRTTPKVPKQAVWL